MEARVNHLLKQVTLEEKIGQLVQYGDTGDEPAAPASQQDAAGGKKLASGAGANPERQNHVNTIQLAETGRLGSMLNLVGAERTNMYQHLAVDKSRLHIPLLCGADILHGFHTVYPEPLGAFQSFLSTTREARLIEPTHYTMWLGGSSAATEEATFNVTR